MYRTTSAIVVVAALFCVADASAQYVRKWAKEGATYDEYLSDRKACLAEASSQVVPMSSNPSHGVILSARPISSQAVADCMVERGYAEDPVNGFAPPDGGVRVYGGSVQPSATKAPD